MNVLCAVDETKGSLKVIEVVSKFFDFVKLKKLYLLYVQKIEGPSLLDDLLLSESEMKSLKEAIEGTPHKEALDKKAQKVLEYYGKKLKEQGLSEIEPVVRAGHPAEEILAASEDLGADLIVIGTRGARVRSLMLGSVSREVVNNAKIPVLVAR